MSNQTPVDILDVDQIWLWEFVQKGFLIDLTNGVQFGDVKVTDVQQVELLGYIIIKYMT
jgi:hypothetical protein